MKRKIATAAAMIAATVGVAACGGNTPTANSRESRAQSADSYNLVTNQPIPAYQHSQIRQELIDIENAEAYGVQSTSFFMDPGDPKPEGSCSSLGAPVAADTELTNPEQQVAEPNASNGGSNVLDQMDPNGVYTGPSSGTYVMCVNPKTGQTYAQYWEGFVRVVFGPAVWDSKTNSPVLVGTPSSSFSNIK